MAPKLIVAVYKSFTEENIILETLKAEPQKFFLGMNTLLKNLNWN